MADFKKLKDGQGNFYNVKDETARTNLASHTGNTSNPHSVTKAQVGLGNVDNTSDANKPISNAQAAVNATKFDKANVKATPASTPSNDNVVSEKYSEETYAKKDGYYETFGYAREAGIANNLKNDEGKLLDPDTTTSSGTIYADQPFTQRATAMTMNAYLNNELISVGSGYEQWKKEQAFSIVRNNKIQNGDFESTSGWNTYNSTLTTNNGIASLLITGSYGSCYSNKDEDFINGHKYLFGIYIDEEFTNDIAITLGDSRVTNINTFHLERKVGYQCAIITYQKNASNYRNNQFVIANFSSDNWETIKFSKVRLIDLTQWFASRPEIATALNGDAGIKWFLQNYPKALTLGYDEGTIVDTEDYEYQTTGVNLWDEEYVATGYILDDGVVSPGYDNRIASKNFIRIFPDTEYYFKVPYLIMDYGVRVAWYDNNMAFIRVTDYYPINNIITSPSNAAYMKFNVHYEYGSSTYNHDIQICQHFTETTVENTYHPYEIYKNGVSWAFTSTGKGKSAGKAADTKDYVNKKNIEKVGRVDLGTLDWATVSISEKIHFYAIIQDLNNQGYDTKLLCAKYSTAYNTSQLVDKTISGVAAASNKNVIVRDDSYSDVATFKAAMSGVYLNYELATYIETDMTGDELDTNIPENDYGVERKVPVSGNMFSGSATTIFYQDNVLRQIYNNKTSIDNLQEEVNNIEAKIPTAPTTDGTYTLKAVVSNGVATYSWTLDSQGV